MAAVTGPSAAESNAHGDEAVYTINGGPNDGRIVKGSLLIDPATSLPTAGSGGSGGTVADLVASGTLTAAQAIGTATTANSAVALALGTGQQSLIVELGATFSAGTTIAVDASTDTSPTTTDWKAITFTASGGTGADLSSTPGPGPLMLYALVSDWAQVRVRPSAVAGGDSVTVAMRASTAPRHLVLVGGKDASGNMKVAPQATENHIGAVGGHTVVASASTFTRPADTTPYASGDLVANSTTAGSVVPLQFTIARVAAGSGMIRRARIRKSGTSITNASFRLHLYAATPATITNGDNGAWNTSGVADYLGSLDVTLDKSFTDGAAGNGVPTTGSEINFSLSSGQIVYGVVEARAAYTPSSAETFSVAIEALQN